jgi:esterase
MKLFFRKYGEGKPLIILHGVFGISDNWVTIGRRLAGKFTVFIPDQRNHGQSPHSDTLNYYVLADDLIEFMEDHQIRNPILIGHSMGGKVAMKVALEYPKRIGKLVVIDISPRGYPSRQEHIEIIQAMKDVNFDQIDSRDEVEMAIAGKIRSEKIRLFILKNLYRIGRRRLGWRLNIEGIYRNIDAVAEPIESSFNYDKPCLFIRGGNSEYIPDEDYDLIVQLFPQAIIETIHDASHWVHAEKPDELCSLLSSFLQKTCEYPV